MAKKKDITKEMGLKEVKMKEKRIGFVDNFSRIAVLCPLELIEKRHQQIYNEEIYQLEKKGYKVVYTSSEKSKQIFCRQVYDVPQELFLNSKEKSSRGNMFC
jgi:hypothetical protein